MFCHKCNQKPNFTSANFIWNMCEQGHLLCNNCSSGNCPICNNKSMKTVRISIEEDSRRGRSSDDPCTTTKIFKSSDLPFRLMNQKEIPEDCRTIASISSSEESLQKYTNLQQEACVHDFKVEEFETGFGRVTSEIKNQNVDENICNLNNSFPSHEHLIAINAYGEVCALPYRIIGPESFVLEEVEMVPQRAGAVETLNDILFPSKQNEEQTCVTTENVNQYFRLLTMSHNHEAGDYCRQIEDPNEFETKVSTEEIIQKCFTKVPSKTEFKSQPQEKEENLFDVSTLNATMSPFSCPLSTCRKVLCNSAIRNHFSSDHPRIPTANVRRGQTLKLVFDPRIEKRGVTKGIALYYVKNKIKSVYGDETLPVLLMTTKFKLTDVLENIKETTAQEDECDEMNLMFWVTAPYAEQFAIPINIYIFNPSFGMAPKMDYGVTKTICPFREEQSIKALYESGMSLIVYHKDCVEYTKNGLDPMQIFCKID